MISPALVVQLPSDQTYLTRVIQECVPGLPLFAKYAFTVFVLPLRPKAPLIAGESQRRPSQIPTTERLRSGRIQLCGTGGRASKKAPLKEMQLKPMKAQLFK